MWTVQLVLLEQELLVQLEPQVLMEILAQREQTELLAQLELQVLMEVLAQLV